MKRKLLALSFVFVLLVMGALPAFAGGPNFGAAIFADGGTWGTKGTATLPAPNDSNRQSFDGLFKFPDGEVEGQLAVAEAAPTNPAYNGGRWIEYNVTWIGEPVLVTSYAQLHDLLSDGSVSISETGAYFQCPLLPMH